MGKRVEQKRREIVRSSYGIGLDAPIIREEYGVLPEELFTPEDPLTSCERGLALVVSIQRSIDRRFKRKIAHHGSVLSDQEAAGLKDLANFSALIKAASH